MIRSSLLRKQATFASRIVTRHYAKSRMAGVPHMKRTAEEPRENVLERVRLAHIHEVNNTVKVLRLEAVDPTHTIKFTPGQWVDTHLPDLKQAGGFTITSTPAEAKPSADSPPYLELAVQKSANPPAEWLWRPEESILGTEIHVRVGGSFTWPPPLGTLKAEEVERLVLVAAGVGINPLISIFSHLIRSATSRPREIHFIYGVRGNGLMERERFLFLPRLMDLVAQANDPNVTLRLFLSGVVQKGGTKPNELPKNTSSRRFGHADLQYALNGYTTPKKTPAVDQSKTLVYVCGPPEQADKTVEALRKMPGMGEERVLCEKWW